MVEGEREAAVDDPCARLGECVPRGIVSKLFGYIPRGDLQAMAGAGVGVGLGVGRRACSGGWGGLQAHAVANRIVGELLRVNPCDGTCAGGEACEPKWQSGGSLNRIRADVG